MSSAPIPSHTAWPAQSLQDSAQLLQLEPLGPDDPLYISLDTARGTRELTKLHTLLRNSARTPNAFVRCAFVGSRGSGKSTYLLHLEDVLQKEKLFTPVHIYLDPKLEADCDYSDLLLWMVDEVAREFAKQNHPVADAELAKIAEWFAETTVAKTTDWKKEIGLTTEASASTSTGIPGIFSFKLLAKLKSMISGSETSRKEIRQQLQNRASDLRERVNDFLDHARATLKAAGKPDRLLVVQDNLDRLRSRDKAQALFDTGGDILTEIRADVIYTAPLALNVAPLDISRIFSHVFTMPNVKVLLRDGQKHAPGIDGLVALIGKRFSIPQLFAGEEVPRYLAEMSGGSVRDLIRLLGEAQLDAQVDGKDRVDIASATRAVAKVSANFTRLLSPGSVYYPILAEIHRTKREFALPAGDATKERVASARDFFAELLGNGSVLEYNGDDSWYDAHPAVRETAQFRDAFGKVAAKK